MAERSFAREVEVLKLGAGEEFRGEGILAITKALLQSGVGYVGGYQGAPISHLMDVLADAAGHAGRARRSFRDIGLGSDRRGDARGLGDVSDPRRGHLEIDGRHQCRLRRAGQSRLGRRHRRRADHHRRGLRRRLLDHAGAQPRLRDEVADLAARPAPQPAVDRQGGRGRLRAVGGLATRRSCWRCASAPATSMAASSPRTTSGRHSRCARRWRIPTRDTGRIVLPPASFLHEKEKIEQRWPAAVNFIKERKLNETLRPDDRRSRHHPAGRHVQWRDARAAAARPRRRLWRRAPVPLYVLNVTYPLIDDEIVAFCAGKQAVLMVEEGQPEFIEQALNTILRRRDIQTRIFGKDVLPMAGEYTAAGDGQGRRGASSSVHAPGVCSATDPPPPEPPPDARTTRRSRRSPTSCRRARRASAPAVRSGRSSPR